MTSGTRAVLVAAGMLGVVGPMRRQAICIWTTASLTPAADHRRGARDMGKSSPAC